MPPIRLRPRTARRASLLPLAVALPIIAACRGDDGNTAADDSASAARMAAARINAQAARAVRTELQERRGRVTVQTSPGRTVLVVAVDTGTAAQQDGKADDAVTLQRETPVPQAVTRSVANGLMRFTQHGVEVLDPSGKHVVYARTGARGDREDSTQRNPDLLWYGNAVTVFSATKLNMADGRLTDDAVRFLVRNACTLPIPSGGRISGECFGYVQEARRAGGAPAPGTPGAPRQ